MEGPQLSSIYGLRDLSFLTLIGTREMEQITCSSFSPKYHLLGQADGLMKKTGRLKSTSIGFAKTLHPPAVTQMHGIINRGQNKNSQSQYSFLLPNQLRKSEDISNGRNCNTFKKFRVPVTLQDGYASKVEGNNSWMSFRDVLHKNFSLLYRFTRFYVCIDTIIAITSVSLLPLQGLADVTSTFFLGILKAVVPAVLMNIYVTTSNQLCDVEIDKVNKPNRPLVSGEISMGTAMAIASTSAVMSLAMGIMFQSPPLFFGLSMWFLIGTVYSVDLPFLRWKKNPLLTAISLVILMGLVYQIPFFAHIQKYVLGRPLVITRSLVFATFFMCLSSLANILLKDLPDEDGDREFGIQTFSLIVGKQRVFWLSVSMLLIAYGSAVIVGASSPFLLSKLVTTIGYSTLASILWLRARSVDLANQASTLSFYLFIWKLRSAEYLLIPFVR